MNYSAFHWAEKARKYAETIGTIFNVKGRVNTVADLPISGNKVGDLYLVGLSTDADLTEYAWLSFDGTTRWERLGYTSITNSFSALTGSPYDNTSLATALNGKQATISDLAAIRSGASAGATALQPSALNGYATESWVNNKGYITGITSAMVTTALGYSPVNPTALATVATSGSYNDLSNKPTIPTVNNPTITITQGGVTKGSFALNQSSGATIALDAGGGGSVNIDNVSITKNGDDEIQTIGVINQNNTTIALKQWSGTKAQYDAISTKDANTIYNITDDTKPTQALLEAIYPVGAIYIGTMNICPLSALFGTWTLVSTKILIDIPSTLEVKGNGIALGLKGSDGVNYGACAPGANAFAGASSQYGVAPYTGNKTGYNPTAIGFGITTDSTKSGIVADTNATSLTVNVWQRTK